MTLLNREIVSRAKLCLVSVFPDIVKDDYPKISNLPKSFLRSFENVALGYQNPIETSVSTECSCVYSVMLHC